MTRPTPTPTAPAPSLYTVSQLGHLAGLAGWWTVLRNGNPVHHFATEDGAREWATGPECALCGEPLGAHRAASGNTPPHCMAHLSRLGDTFVRGGQ